MKIRIFALARDLGLDSKVLIDLCEQAGVKLRNALATISEEERDAVVAYIRSKGTTASSDVAAVEITPMREVPLVVGKVRQIVGIPARTSSRAQDETDAAAIREVLQLTNRSRSMKLPPIAISCWTPLKFPTLTTS